jgi:hypothetical protein
MTAARYVMSVGLGRCIDARQHVDHIDGNSRNDTWKNLQVVSASDNLRKGPAVRTVKVMQFFCAVCSKMKTRRGLVSSDRTSRVLFCTPACRDKFNTLSRSFRDHAVVADAISKNKTTEIVLSRRVTVPGLRLRRVSKDLDAVLAFLDRTDKGRNPADLGTCYCGTHLKQSRRTYCSQACAVAAVRASRPVPKPTAAVLAAHIKAKISYCAIGRMYGVSDSAIRKWARGYSLL